MELKDIDQPGYLVHGSYVQNLPKIVRAGGVYPYSMLPDELKPARSFGGKQAAQDKAILAKANSISTVVLHDNSYGYRQSIVEENLWGDPAKFHFHIVSNHPFRELGKSIEELYLEFGEDFDSRTYSKPFYIEGSEVVLRNQCIPLETFVSFVIPTNEMIAGLSDKIRTRVFGEIKTAEEIAQTIEKLRGDNLSKIPIFYFDGRRH